MKNNSIKSLFEGLEDHINNVNESRDKVATIGAIKQIDFLIDKISDVLKYNNKNVDIKRSLSDLKDFKMKLNQLSTVVNRFID